MPVEAATATIDAIYEEGILRPLEPLPLQEGEQVRLRIERAAAEDRLKALDELIDACAELSEEQWEIFDEASARRRPFFREPSAIVNNFTLVTHNTAHFARIAELSTEDWLAQNESSPQDNE